MYVYRWDLDKTYLATDFHSLRGLWTAATEPAHQKRNVPGSAALLRALCARPGARVVVVSGSPTQMREVLEEKLRLDGVRFDELHLKDNLGNLKRGRLKAVRGQVGYKLPLLLQGRVGLGPAVRELLFGDDAEADALIYSVFADVVAGRMRPAELSRVMEAAGAYPDTIASTLPLVDRIPSGDIVDRIFIHLDRGVPPARFERLGPRLTPVHSWVQAALTLVQDGHIPAAAALAVAREVQAAGLDADAVANLAQDAVRRGLFGPEAVEALAAAADDEAGGQLAARCLERIRWLGPPPPRQAPRPPVQVDYLRLIAALERPATPEGPP